MIDSDRCELVTDWARAHPHLHDQRGFFYLPDPAPTVFPVSVFTDEADCAGGFACLAGIAAILFAPAGTRYESGSGRLLFPDGEEEYVSDFTERTLRLPSQLAANVFWSDRDTAIRRLCWLAKHPKCTSPEELRAATPAKTSAESTPATRNNNNNNKRLLLLLLLLTATAIMSGIALHMHTHSAAHLKTRAWTASTGTHKSGLCTAKNNKEERRMGNLLHRTTNCWCQEPHSREEVFRLNAASRTEVRTLYPATALQTGEGDEPDGQ